MSRRKYVLDNLNEIDLLGTKTYETTKIQKLKLGLKGGEFLEDPKQYRRFVGKLNYFTITSPDIPFLVSVISSFMNSQ